MEWEHADWVRNALCTAVQAQLQAAQAQQAVDAQQAAVSGVVQGTPHDGGPAPQGCDNAASFTYRNRARRKACEKPVVRVPSSLTPVLSALWLELASTPRAVLPGLLWLGLLVAREECFPVPDCCRQWHVQLLIQDDVVWTMCRAPARSGSPSQSASAASPRRPTSCTRSPMPRQGWPVSLSPTCVHRITGCKGILECSGRSCLLAAETKRNCHKTRGPAACYTLALAAPLGPSPAPADVRATQVFLFCANEKGASWAYATPGFGASLAPAHLKMLRQMAMPDIDEAVKVGGPPFVAAARVSGRLMSTVNGL